MLLKVLGSFFLKRKNIKKGEREREAKSKRKKKNEEQKKRSQDS